MAPLDVAGHDLALEGGARELLLVDGRPSPDRRTASMQMPRSDDHQEQDRPHRPAHLRGNASARTLSCGHPRSSVRLRKCGGPLVAGGPRVARGARARSVPSARAPWRRALGGDRPGAAVASRYGTGEYRYGCLRRSGAGARTVAGTERDERAERESWNPGGLRVCRKSHDPPRGPARGCSPSPSSSCCPRRGVDARTPRSKAARAVELGPPSRSCRTKPFRRPDGGRAGAGAGGRLPLVPCASDWAIADPSRRSAAREGASGPR